jgi:hypothetical protein
MRRGFQNLLNINSAGAVIALIFVPLLFVVSAARAAAQPHWRFAPAQAPPPPAEVAPAPYPVPLGEVGEISFWAPNRGLLVTGGTQSKGGAVAGGLYAYDGISWHQLSSVCGSARGRLAWAGPDEFWTISDQRAGQITSLEETSGELEDLSLCHFQGDQVVGSYAMPLGQPDSYLKMDAAACLSPSDCWFAGEDGRAPNVGSFHLHWNGSEMSALYDSEDHAVTGMASFDGRFYEGLAVGPEDSYLPEEYLPQEDESGAPPAQPPKHPAVIRTIAPAGQTQLCGGVGSAFCDKFLFSGQPLPVYPEKVVPDALGGFDLATDGSPLGTGATQLWAGADPVERTPAGSVRAAVTILHGDADGTWTQIVPTAGGSAPLSGAQLRGSATDHFTSQATSVGDSIAPMPGTESAWLSLSSEGGNGAAHVALLEADGTVPANTDLELPVPGEGVGDRGNAGPIACPADNDCWMATSDGWLFHLTDGAPLVPNTDPLFDGEDGVIALRPLDGGVPVVYPDGFAEDDSLANQQPAPSQPPEQTSAEPAKPKKAKPLVRDVKSRFLHDRVLVITFKLTGRAHVQLIAREHRRVVGETRDESLRAGAHTLSLSLDPARWPTKLSLDAEPIGAPTSSSVPESPNTEDTFST